MHVHKIPVWIFVTKSNPQKSPRIAGRTTRDPSTSWLIYSIISEAFWKATISKIGSSNKNQAGKIMKSGSLNTWVHLFGPCSVQNVKNTVPLKEQGVGMGFFGFVFLWWFGDLIWSKLEILLYFFADFFLRILLPMGFHHHFAPPFGNPPYLLNITFFEPPWFLVANLRRWPLRRAKFEETIRLTKYVFMYYAIESMWAVTSWPWLFALYIVDEIPTHLYGDYFINQYKDPY